MSLARRFLRRSARLTALGRGVRDAIRGPGASSPTTTSSATTPSTVAADVNAGIVELHRISPRPGAPGGGPRLTLLLPTLEPNRLFGGARTALDLFEGLAASFPRRRIVTFTAVSEAALAGLEGYRLMSASADDDPSDPRLVVAAPRGAETSLAVGPEDVFLATFWTTAELAIRLVRWQAATLGRPIRPFASVVQDFEPGFYPWSAQSELARSTYANAVPTIGVVNTSLLADYLDEQGVRFERRFVFEPRLSAGLGVLLDEPARERRRTIVAYGRPETPRNAFPLIVEGLRTWRAAADRPRSGDWTVVSAGRSHPPVDLGGGLRMTSVGKLDLAGYGTLLRESAIGLSLMISPHPSYPPLEMAHLGMLVATNRFATKDLATWHENITSIESLTPEAVAATLRALTARFEADPSGGDRGRPLRPEFLDGGPPFPFLDELAAALLEPSRAASAPTMSRP